jgi:hypothetical protein
VGEFAEALLARVREARADLAAAVEAEDAYAASVAQIPHDQGIPTVKHGTSTTRT